MLQNTRAVAIHAEAVPCIMRMLEESSRQEGRALCIEAIGHPVVQGSEQFQEPVRIDDEVFAAIDRLVELAPLHNPVCVAGTKEARA